MPGLLFLMHTGCAQSWGKFWDVNGGSANMSAPVIDNTGTAMWARSANPAPNQSVFSGVAVDSSGAIYAAGYQDNSGSFTYEGQSISGPSSSTNVALVKYNSSGSASWARTMSAGSFGQFFGIAADPSGNLFACGVQTTAGTYTYSGQNATGTNATANVVIVKYDSNGNGLWASSVTSGAAQSYFYSVAADINGNAYAVGYQTNTGAYTYAGQTINGINASSNATLVKYSAAGTGVWARTPTSGGVSEFFGVTTDAAGNVYVVGSQSNTSTFTYGGTTATGAYAGANAVIVKFDAAGNGLWARTQTTCGANSVFNRAAVSASGDVYAVGYQEGNGSCTYGGTTVSGPYAAGANPIIVKFDAAGNGLWARSTSATTNGGPFKGVAVDTLGNVYAAGQVATTISYTFGSQTIAGTAGGVNPTLVKYSSSGTVLWARTISSGTNSAEFLSVAASSGGQVYAVGSQNNNQAYTYGQDVSATGAYNSGTNAVIVKYE